MKRFFFLSVLLLLVSNCGEKPGVVRIQVEEFSSLQKKESPTLVDVRSVEEFDAGHISGAINIPMMGMDFEQRFFRQIGRDESVVIYCAAGKKGSRSDRAAEIAIKKERNRVYLLEGGYRAYNSKK